MSNCIDRLLHILSMAKSRKVIEYKKAIKLLLEFLEDNSETTFEQITEYSINQEANIKCTYSWNDIFNIVHELFMLEIDRISKGNSGKLEKERIVKLVYTTTDKANYYLNPKDIVISNLQILTHKNAPIYSEFYEMYLGILKKYVLQERSQRILVDSNHWQELLLACINILKNVILNIDYVKFLQTIDLIVQYGCSLSTLLFETRKLLPLIANLLENYELYKIKSTDILFKLTYTVCQQIAIDSRFILCQFAENMPVAMINFKAPEEKYKLYFLFMQVHHPNGALLNDDICCTYNVEKWKAILNLLYKMILSDIKPIMLSKSFITLACEVFRQKIFNNLPNVSSNTFHDSIYIQPKKRRCMSDNQDKIVDLVNDKDPERAWPIIQIATALYKKYPDCLKLNEYLEFLDVMIKLLSQACKNFYIMESLCELATVFVQNENRYKFGDLKMYWDKIWDATLRYLSMSHIEIIEKGCTLVQNLIVYEKISNPNLLLKLYLMNSIQSSNFSILTLKIFCENIVLPHEINDRNINLSLLRNNSLKMQLLQWTLNILSRRSIAPLPIEELGQILIGFTLKSWFKSIENHFQESINNNYINLNYNLYDDITTVSTADIERSYLSLKFKTELFIDQNSILNARLLNKYNIENPYIKEDLDFLINSLMDSVQMNDIYKDLNSFIIKTALIATVISNLITINIIQCSFNEFCLVNILKSCLSTIFDQIRNINWSKTIRFTLEVTKSLILLYQTKYDTLINEILLKSMNYQILKKIYNISKIEDEEFESNSKISQCKINAKIILALYCCIDDGNKMSELQIKITSSLLKLKKYSLSVKSDIICVITILKIFANISNRKITEEFTQLLVSFISELFEKWHKDNLITYYLLQLLPIILEKVKYIQDKNNVYTNNILLICKIYHDNFASGMFGQLIHLLLVQSLNSIVKHNAFYCIKANVFNEEMFLTFISSPYYLVRLECLKYLYTIFFSSEFTYNWKLSFFNKLKSNVYNIFLLQKELNNDELQEERLLRTTSGLQILGVIICSKSIFQCSALITLLEIVVDKDIDINIVKKIFKIIEKVDLSMKDIIIKNLNYLLFHWCNERNLENFPYSLLDCLNKKKFYNRYIRVIFPVLINKKKILDAKNLCRIVNIDFEQIFKDCCPKITPLLLTENFSEMFQQIKNKKGIFENINCFSTIVRENLQESIIELVERLHDDNDFYVIFKTSITLPTFDVPHLKKEIVDNCFKILKTIVYDKTDETLFFFLITENPSIIQRIFLKLIRNVYTYSILENKAKSFHQYVYFCTIIANELIENYCDSVATYFIKDIVCTLLNFAKDNEDFFRELACKYLLTFLTIILPKRSTQVDNIFNLCVKILTSLIIHPYNCSFAENVLLFLLNDQSHYFSTAIEKLNNLPRIIKFNNDHDTISQLLHDNMQHFLNINEDNNYNIDNLLFLKSQLIIKKTQLKKMYEELENSSGFAEYCATSILHRLIYKLIHLTKHTNVKIGIEAAKCLGILGPADLYTMILYPQVRQIRESEDEVYMLTRIICETLADSVVSADINLKIVSSELLYTVLDTPWGAYVLDQEFEDNQNSIFLKNFLFPFRSLQKFKTLSNLNLQTDVIELNQVFCEKNLLWSEISNGSYEIWICNITSAIANCFTNFYSKSLLPVFKLNVQFCELTLPRLISLIVYYNSNILKNVCTCINYFFHFHFYEYEENEALSYLSQKIQKYKAYDAIRCMLNVVNHLRIRTKRQINLDFNYLPIAIAAQFCSAYFSSILYAELWCLSNLKIIRYFESIPIIDQIYEQENKHGKVIQNVLKEAYIKISDSDSIHGCGSSYLQNRKSRIPYYTHFKKMDKLILSQDVELSITNSSTRGMVNTLKESSLYYLANLLRTTPMKLDLMEDLCYDSLWRLSDWSQTSGLNTNRISKNNYDFSTNHYEALKCLHENNKTSLQIYLKQAYLGIIRDLSNISLESCKAVYPKLSQLQMLREIEEFSSIEAKNYNDLLANWDNKQYISNSNNFEYVEPILSQRTVMFQIQQTLKDNTIFKDALIKVQLKIVELAKQQKHLNVAARTLETLSKQINLNEETENILLYHEACLAWMRHDEDIAKFNLRSLIKKKSIKHTLLTQVLRTYGNWIAHNKSEHPQAIINKYYNKAINIYSKIIQLDANELSDKYKAHAALAQFAHEQYLTIIDYITSPQFESLKECIDYSRNVSKSSIKMQDVDVARAVRINSKQISNDCIELENIKKDKIMYLLLAIKNYLIILHDSDEHDFIIFRLVSLWLSNMYDEDVNKILEKKLDQIPSYKFIVLIPQLAPHMSNVMDVFTNKILDLVQRCAKEHPHHTLPTLLALKNLYNDFKFCSKKIIKQEPRVLAAAQLIQSLLSTKINPIIYEMDKLSNALVSLAYYELDRKKVGISKYSIPKNLALNNIKHFKHSIIPTITIEIKKNGNYTNIISINKYELTYSNVGGINAPKKIICIGTDGIERPQLVKGKDDLRQDAVMQQVFSVLNSLLKSNNNTKQRKLNVHTYKVVPLTQRSGILQWCENTLPLSNILTGDNHQIGLHEKYYPNDYSPNDCRKKLHIAKSIEQKFNTFMDCCQNLHPAFHYFFTENYLSPEIWFERRLTYTRSVATSSIIGYILGLGDRHVSNILINKTTAEVIHIDFGIAFEQGKVLPTPETVPFRLTRDIEIAMGVSGIEGTMRRCCEETMSVLRDHKEIIVTLLRVLLYDPLYFWAITPAQAAIYQSDHYIKSSESKETNFQGTTEINKLAERALLRVHQKLQGTEEGTITSIAGQVERLIQHSRDPRNLSRLFEGWQAYL